MKVEKAREKDGKLELLVELSVSETEEELQNAAMAVVARNGYGADRADYETPLECVRVRICLLYTSRPRLCGISVSEGRVFKEGLCLSK